MDALEKAHLDAFMARVNTASEVYDLFESLYSDIIEYDGYLFEVFNATGDIEGVIKDDIELGMERAIGNYEPWELISLIKKHYEK